MDAKQLDRIETFVGIGTGEIKTRNARKWLKRNAKVICRKECYKEYLRRWQRDGYSILNYAAIHEHVIFIDVLLEYFKLDPNLLQGGKTTLHYAVESGYVKAVETLLKTNNRSDINARDHFGSSPLHVAIYHGKEDIAQMLLQYNARTDMQNHFGTALYTAIVFENAELVKAIHRMYPNEVNSAVQGFCTPILCSILDESDACENFLIEVCDVAGQALIDKVISHNDDENVALKVVKALLDRGANAVLKRGRSFLSS